MVKVPVDTRKGQIKIFVDGKESTGQSFTYQAIHKIKLLTGRVGTKLTISGEGFDNDLRKNLVYFNRLQAKVFAPTDLTTGALKVETNGMVAETPKAFRRSSIITIIKDLTILGYNYSIIRVDSYRNIYINGSNKVYKITQEETMSVFTKMFSSTIRFGILKFTKTIYNVIDGAALKKSHWKES